MAIFEKTGDEDIKITAHFYLSGQRIASITQLGFEERYDTYDAIKVFWYHSDHLGTASLVTDKEGKPYERVEYTPYGEVWNEHTSDTSLNFIESGFTSKPLDKETGLYNFPQRYYDSRNVKWMTLDPIGPRLMMKNAGSVTSLNWYNYCGNNPVMYHDPEGLTEKTKEAAQASWQKNHDENYTGTASDTTVYDSKDVKGGLFLDKKKKTGFEMTVTRKAKSWDTADNTTYDDTNAAIDSVTVTNHDTGNSITIEMQTIPNAPGYEGRGNAIIGDFELTYVKGQKSDAYEGEYMRFTKGTTYDGTIIQSDGTGILNGVSVGDDAWLLHSNRKGGASVDWNGPYSGGCFMADTYGAHQKLYNFLENEGIESGTVIKGTINEKKKNIYD